MSWEKVSIGEYVTLRQGFAINKNTKHHISDEKTALPLLRIADMKDGSKNVFVKDTIPKTFLAHPEDIIYTRTGQVGLVFKNQFGVIHNNCFTVTPNDEKILCRDYLFYALQSNEFFIEANSLATGAAQPDLPHGAFKTINIYLPPLETQHRIASILSAYDDLIENNQKQIKLLEEAAHSLYKEWFVDLRFPGYEDVEIVDGVPEGWRKVPIHELIDFEIGGGWGEEETSQKSTKPAYVIRGTDIFGITHGDYLALPFRFHAESNLASRKLNAGDIIFEVSGGSKTEGVAKTVLITHEFLNQFSYSVICASFCKLVRAQENLSQYLYDTFQYMRKCGTTSEYDKKSASSIVNYRWKDFLSQQYVLLPCDIMIQKYNETANSIYKDVINHSITISKLKQSRDRLLPKLMSGELEV